MLVDTSIWVDHLRHGDARLAAALEANDVHIHPFVIGELACGRITRRAEVLELLAALPRVPVAEHEEVLAFVERHALAGAGLGWIDAHILASAALARVPLWTRDARLAKEARRLGV